MRILLIAAAALFNFSEAGMASVMDFNNLATDPNGLVSAGATITQSGYTITDTTSGTHTFTTQFEAAAAGWQSGRGTNNGTTTVGMQSENSSTPLTFTLTSSTSTPFNFASIDLGSLNAHNAQFYNSIATKWTFVGALTGGGSVSETINSDPNNILTYNLNSTFQNLTSVSITAELPVMGIPISNGAGVTADFDNIVATQYTPGVLVPEPTTLALLVGSLVGVTALRRMAKGRRALG